jgi:hypothetical protein
MVLYDQFKYKVYNQSSYDISNNNVKYDLYEIHKMVNLFMGQNEVDFIIYGLIFGFFQIH